MSLTFSHPQPALAALRHVQAGWGDRPVSARLPVLTRFRHLLTARLDECLAELGRARPSEPAELLSSEVLPLLDGCRFLEQEAASILSPHRPSPRSRPAWLWGVSLEIRREPLGVVLVVGPSNYPLFLPGIAALQALAAGNAVLLKPAPGCTAPIRFVQQLLEQAGLPTGLLALAGETPEAVHQALEAGVDKLLVIGSAATGRAVLESAGRALVPAVAELSGCDAAFVGPGADLEVVARALAFSLRLNRGQTCLATRRCFVPRPRLGELEQRLRSLLDSLPPIPLSRTSVEAAAAALEAGGRLLWGRLTPAPATGPLVLSCPPLPAVLLREALMDSALWLVAVDSEEQALELARTSPYALTVSLFGHLEWALGMSHRVRAGVVVVNDLIAPTADPRLCFGGRGRSGFGSSRGAEGLLEMTAPRAVAVREKGPRYHLDPPAAADAAVLSAYARASHAGSLWSRLGGVLRMIGCIARERYRRARERQKKRG